MAAHTDTANSSRVGTVIEGGVIPCTPDHNNERMNNMRNRNVGINIRVTENEKKRIVLLAGKCGMSVSEYLRRLATGYSPREVPSDNFYAVRRLLEQLGDSVTGAELNERLARCLDALEGIYIRGEEAIRYGGDKHMGDTQQSGRSDKLR